ncbi:hypothetical protein CU669_18895 [Paramagnetospirillum kuznetsovii]|uniref:DUF2946 domain-containing protein n=1 Tax=Paramagnetospirillum kuznetsovii TaxID=2053833 RepID=A0A364NTC3_9PROT|nr:DUF2946 family protein [Paramagnetospirillum kuznetsovii]RAU20316.1 hypothetical protein CU669_18895 [Paramagnetospirillum kuznetsovii]
MIRIRSIQPHPAQPLLKRLGCWLALVVLTLQLAGAAVAPTISPAIIATADDHMVICTVGGMVELGEDGLPIPATPAKDHVGPCVFCLPLLHGHVLAQTLATTAFDRTDLARSEKILPSSPTHAPPVRLAGAASPQAPPVS